MLPTLTLSALLLALSSLGAAIAQPAITSTGTSTITVPTDSTAGAAPPTVVPVQLIHRAESDDHPANVVIHVEGTWKVNSDDTMTDEDRQWDRQAPFAVEFAFDENANAVEKTEYFFLKPADFDSPGDGEPCTLSVAASPTPTAKATFTIDADGSVATPSIGAASLRCMEGALPPAETSSA
ncbi:hypothetical protein I317_01269 [Kwoniella heveanensis CBS 569]|uniref:Uncharacterized protein n=1 Tax=Kwoniella heveanensis BCC8398 TaxID=1296120 RepID=A0A1B9GS08_9TREE|nr:hypothetical protein I316_04489 [Kwoniella heveanensis BCC8398]OCF44780.1 hypothetical protein I317_01269 [Kwoniella heveanensis CBS 569]